VRKRSVCVNLVLLGSAAGLYGCEGPIPVDLQQQRYASQEECHRDWGDDPKNCSQSQTPIAGGHGYYYVGPRYFWDTQSNRPIAVGADGAERAIPGARIARTGSTFGSTVRAGSFARGGFGSSAHGFGGASG
jgi:hypothetical protein